MCGNCSKIPCFALFLHFYIQPKSFINKLLYEVIQNLYEKTYKIKNLFIGEPKINMEVKVTDTYGCDMVSLCFIDFE